MTSKKQLLKDLLQSNQFVEKIVAPNIDTGQTGNFQDHHMSLKDIANNIIVASRSIETFPTVAMKKKMKNILYNTI